jgi:hypothetical protein
MQKAGHELAKAEYAYKKALRIEVLKDRAKETPVGVIDKTVYGEDDVNLLRLKRNISRVDYEMYQEMVLLLKMELRLLDAQISREWSNDT